MATRAELGRANYEAYCGFHEQAGGMAGFDGEPWDELSDEERLAWEKAAEAVVEKAYERPSRRVPQ